MTDIINPVSGVDAAGNEVMFPSIEAASASATAYLDKKTAEFRNSPDGQLARAEQYAQSLGNDASAHEAALRNVARLKAIADKAAEKVVDPDVIPPTASRPLDDLDRAFSLVDQENAAGRIIGIGPESTINGSMSTRDMMEQIKEYRALEISDGAIREAIYGAKYPAAIIQQAKERLAQRRADPVWVERLATLDKDVRKEFTLLNIVINASVMT